MSDGRSWQTGCQYGNHGEPFLWAGSGDDEIDIAIKRIINLFEMSPELAREAAEFIEACYADAEKKVNLERIGE